MKRRKQILQKIMCFAMGVALLGTVACGKVQEETQADSETAAATTITKETTVTERDTGDGADTEETTDVYEAFLSGNGELSFSYYMKNVYQDVTYKSYEDEFLGLCEEIGYTLPDLVKAFNNILASEDYYSAGGEITYVGYAYVDFGNDDSNEMVLRLVGPFVEPESELYLVAKEVNQELQVVYATTAWSRNYTYINEYGVIQSSGSNGATNHSWEVGTINAAGLYQFGCMGETEADLSMFAMNYGLGDLDFSNLENDVVIYMLRTEEPAADGKMQYYSYLIHDPETWDVIEDTDLYSDSDYTEALEQFTDVSFMDYEEMERLKEEKLNSIGITEEMLDGEELEYSQLYV